MDKFKRTLLKNLVDKFERAVEEEDKMDDALEKFCEAVNPGSHPIFFENAKVQGFLDCLACVDISLCEEFSQYLYDVLRAPTKKKSMEVEVDGKEYKITNKESLLYFLVCEYGD